MYLGTNTEMQGLPLNATIHAEQFAMVIALQAGEGIISFAATAAPCGHCRQFLNELREGGDVRVLSLMVDKFDKTKFDSLLSDLLLHSLVLLISIKQLRSLYCWNREITLLVY